MKSRWSRRLKPGNMYYSEDLIEDGPHRLGVCCCCSEWNRAESQNYDIKQKWSYLRIQNGNINQSSVCKNNDWRSLPWGRQWFYVYMSILCLFFLYLNCVIRISKLLYRLLELIQRAESTHTQTHSFSAGPRWFMGRRDDRVGKHNNNTYSTSASQERPY